MASGFNFGTPTPKTTVSPAFGSNTPTFGAQPIQNGPFGGVGPTTGTGMPNANPTTGGGFQFMTTTNPGALTVSSTSSLFSTAPQNNSLNFKSGIAPISSTSGVSSLFATTPSVGTGLNFGATPNVTSTIPNFGTPIVSSSANTNPGLTFATPQMPTSTAPSLGGFGVPATSATPGLTFGIGTANTTAPGLFTTATTANATAPTLGLPFGTPQNPVPTLSNFVTSSALPTSTFGGLGGSSAVTSLTAATEPVALSTGLGGVATTQTKTAVTTQKETPPKEQQLPNEIQQNVEQFKEFVKNQKSYSSDVARCSVREFRKVEQEIDLLNNLLNEVESQLQKNRHIAEKLKYETVKCFQNVEMAQRTHDTPPGLQYENVEPLKFFLDLVDHFEHEMHSLKMQIDSADRYVKNHKSPDALGPQDLAMGMRRLHETFVALAGRLQSVHNQVETQKEMYIQLHRHVYNDPTNPFDKLYKQDDLLASSLKRAIIYSPPKVASGPTPFNNLTLNNNGTISNLQQPNNQLTMPPAYPTSTIGNLAPQGGLTFGLSSTGNQTSNSSLFGNTSFQLQKPPTGTKRGKQ